MRNEVIIKANDLAYASKMNKILFQNVCFEYSGGDIICLLGNNGAGKSTLLKVCAGILEPTYGEILFTNGSGILLNDLRKENLLSWLSQYLQRPENFNVVEFLSLNERSCYNNSGLSKKNKIDFQAILRDFDLLHLEKRELIELSGGEWKRVQLARIWAEKAKILFLDEPESDLDISHKQQLIHKCKQYAQQNNSTIFMTTHDLFFAKEVANKICALSEGLWVWNSDADIFWKSNIIQKLYGIRKTLG